MLILTIYNYISESIFKKNPVFITCVLIFLWIGFSANNSFSQIQSKQIIEEIKNYYRAMNYEQAEQKARDALINYNQFAPAELVELHKYLALINFAQGKIEESKKQFKTALSLKPDLVLSPLYVSPKIIEFLNQVKAEVRSGPGITNEFSVKYVVVKDKRFNASLRSLILPGWGQLYKGEKKKGMVLIALCGVSLGGLLATHVEYNKARQEYVAAEQPFEIQSKYRVYNNYYRARNSMAVFTMALWLYAHIDAMIKKAPGSPEVSDPTRAQNIYGRFDHHQLIVTYQFVF